MSDRKIFITGCAKTGTTLMRRLFNAFEGLKVCNNREIPVDLLCDSDYNVGKRTFNSILAGQINSHVIFRELRWISKYNVQIVHMKREKADVLKNRGGATVSEKRFNHVIKQEVLLKSWIDVFVLYKHLLSDPDDAQQRVADILQLSIKHKWTEFPDFIDLDDEDPHTINDNYKLRPIGEPK